MKLFKIVALVVALMAQVPFIPSASADGRHEGYVNIDGTFCHMGPADGYAAYGDPMWYGMPISILVADTGDGWTMIDPVGNGESCLVPLGSTAGGSLQPAVEPAVNVSYTETTTTADTGTVDYEYIPETSETYTESTDQPTLVTSLPNTGSGLYAIDLGVDGIGTKPELTNAQESTVWVLLAGIVIFLATIVAIRRHDIRREERESHVEPFRR